MESRNSEGNEESNKEDSVNESEASRKSDYGGDIEDKYGGDTIDVSKIRIDDYIFLVKFLVHHLLKNESKRMSHELE